MREAENTSFLSIRKGPDGEGLLKPPDRGGLGPRPFEELGPPHLPTWPPGEAGTGEVKREMEQVPRRARLQGEGGALRVTEAGP